MPKVGGSSLGALLKNHFQQSFLGDYGDYPINKSENRRKIEAEIKRNKNILGERFFSRFRQVECIHDHFLPYKYLGVFEEVNFITWLRDPIERLGSHYHYWKRSYSPGSKGALRKRMIVEDWSFEEFCFSEEMRNMYTRFLFKFPVDNFSFIGVFEFYDEDLSFFVDNFLVGKGQVEVVKKM